MEVNNLRTNRRAQIGNITIPLLKGDQGYSISRIVRTSGGGGAGTTDTYTVYIDTDPETAIGTFQVVNGTGGDMFKSVYDINNDDIVDRATGDGNGNEITATYETIENVTALASRVATLEQAGYITKSVADLANYYLKSETYTKQEVNNLCDRIPKFAIEVVSVLPTQDISETTIYLLRDDEETQDVYQEYIYVNNTWERIGGQRIDLSNYYQISEVDGLLNAKADITLVNKKTYYFDTVANMLDYNLQENDYVITKGYYSVNDGGGASYYITSTSSQTEYQETLDNGLFANLIFDNEIKIKQLGALSGSSHDITSKLSFAINTGLQVKNDNLDEAFYITSPIATKTDIKMKNINLVCNFASDGYLFTFNNNVAGYDLELVDCIINGNLKCVGVNSRVDTKDAKNFILKNVEIYGMSSENNASGTFPKESAVTMKGANCYAENCNIHDNQGHGLMIFSASRGNSSTGVFNITNCKATGNGVGTYQALGIGSYSGTNNAKCFISNCCAYGNGASGIAPHGINNVIIENCISNNNGEHGFVIQQSNDSMVNNCIALNNSAFGIRVQGDFSQAIESRFVNNVCVLNNKITGNGINVGVKAKKILCKNNIITISSNQKVFYTDNTSQSRNNGSEDVSFINNIVIGSSYAHEPLRDYFKGFVFKDNTDMKGNLLPNGFLVYSGNNNSLNMYISTDKLYEPITPDNTNQMVNISGFNGATISGNTFTTSAEVNADLFLVIGRFNAKEKMTFVLEYPDGTIPWVRSRNSNQGLIADYILINTTENNGYTNKMTLTITKDDSNENSEAIKYIDIALKTVKFEKFPAGTYNFKMICSEGLTLNE